MVGEVRKPVHAIQNTVHIVHTPYGYMQISFGLGFVPRLYNTDTVSAPARVPGPRRSASQSPSPHLSRPVSLSHSRKKEVMSFFSTDHTSRRHDLSFPPPSTPDKRVKRGCGLGHAHLHGSRGSLGFFLFFFLFTSLTVISESQSLP